MAGLSLTSPEFSEAAIPVVDGQENGTGRLLGFLRNR